MDEIVVARALHVLAIVIWIGGLAMATTVVLPAVRRGDLGPDRAKVFHAIEQRFVWQARISIIIVGLTGFYMMARLDLWERFHSAQFWWMHAMVCLWLLFTVVLFVAEPFVVACRFRKWATSAPQVAFRWLNRVHWVLLALSLITIFGVVAGSQGWSLF